MTDLIGELASVERILVCKHGTQMDERTYT
jgi:hypothetical protein